jgi:hypothetical protein
MNELLKRLCLAGAAGIVWLLVAAAAWASPYSAISERNVFGLKDPPPATPTNPEPEPEPPPNVKITGITTIMGVQRALVKVQAPAKPPAPAKDESYIMVAGGPAQGGVEVLEIQDSADLKDVKVKIRQAGKESWLNLEKDAPKAAAAAAPPGANPAQVAAAQAAAQKLAAARAAAGGVPPPVIPTRPVRTAQPGVPGVPGANPGLATTTMPRTRVFQAREQVGNMTPEEQIILIEANRLNTIQEQAEGLVPPPPATELTPPELDPTVPAEQDPMNQAPIPGLPQ